jgi:hypothetical protein
MIRIAGGCDRDRCRYALLPRFRLRDPYNFGYGYPKRYSSAICPKYND